MPTRRAEACIWCAQVFEHSGRRWPLCYPCCEEYRERCLRVGEAVWQSIPWDYREGLALGGQYVDTRFLFEAAIVSLQKDLNDWRASLLGTTSPLRRDSITAEQARQVVSLWAPHRYPWGDTPDVILDFHLAPSLEYFTDKVREYYGELASRLAEARPQDWDLDKGEEELSDLKDGLVEDLLECLPSGRTFLRCLLIGARLQVPPRRVFRHLVFGESIVEEPWFGVAVPLRKGESRWAHRRPLNFGPYLGRFPPARWKKLGLRQSLENQIRLWTCYLLEGSGLSARAAMATWDQQAFHGCQFDAARDQRDGTTSAAESNYTRDKKWLRRRLALFHAPLEEIAAAVIGRPIPRSAGLKMDLSDLSDEDLARVGAIASSLGYEPDI